MTTKHTDEELLAIGDEIFNQDLSDAIAADDNTTTPPAAPGEPMVVRSLRLPVDVHQRINAAAQDAGIAPSTLMRQAIEAHLAVLEDDEPVSRAEVVRMIGMLRPVSHRYAA